MPLKKLSLKAKTTDRDKRLDQVLAEWLPAELGRPVSKAKVRKLIQAGAVYLNGHRARIASKPVIPGAMISAHVDVQKLFDDSRSGDRVFVMGPENILFEDEHLIIVDKPAGLPTQPTLDDARDNLYAAVGKYLATREGRPQVYLGLHHRLDRDTSGAILFTKTRDANAPVSEMFKSHKIQKVYQAIASGAPRAGIWSVENYLAPDKTGGKRNRFTAVKSGGDFAHTDFTVLKRLEGAFLVEARPVTGRTHQIRVHLSLGGNPILGDFFYGGPDHGSGGKLMLHAVSLTFAHPFKETTVAVQSRPPEEFQKCLNRLENPKKGSGTAF